MHFVSIAGDYLGKHRDICHAHWQHLYCCYPENETVCAWGKPGEISMPSALAAGLSLSPENDILRLGQTQRISTICIIGWRSIPALGIWQFCEASIHKESRNVRLFWKLWFASHNHEVTTTGTCMHCRSPLDVVFLSAIGMHSYVTEKQFSSAEILQCESLLLFSSSSSLPRLLIYVLFVLVWDSHQQ